MAARRALITNRHARKMLRDQTGIKMESYADSIRKKSPKKKRGKKKRGGRKASGY